MNYNKDKNFLYHISDIINNEEYKIISTIPHHGETRLDHSYKVAYNSYKIAKFLKLDYVSVARAGMLHDFYVDTTKDYKKISKKIKLFAHSHPLDAVNNSKKLFELNKLEEDIIKTHMFPFNLRVPKYLESWIVNIVDTFIGAFEFSKKFSYQMNLFVLFFVNFRK